MDANITDAYKTLMIYLENNPETKEEIESIIIMAKLNEYVVDVSAYITDYEDAFLINFWLSGKQRVQLDLMFNNAAKLKKVCTCKNNEQFKCNEIDYKFPVNALNRIKEIL